MLAPSYPGAEAAVRYAQLLKSQGQAAEAQKVARDLLEQARIAPAHYRRAQSPGWTRRSAWYERPALAMIARARPQR